MTAEALLHHVFSWEIAPGVARDDDHADEPRQDRLNVPVPLDG